MASSPVDVIIMDTSNGAPHQCNVCYKVFVSSKGLQQHSIIHTDRKPFSCEICGKPFRFKSNLFEHRSIHTGEQPYICPFCGKACRLKGNLKKHLKTHVKESDEIDRAYEAVTGSHISNTSNDEGEYYENNTPRVSKQRRKTFNPRKIDKNSSGSGMGVGDGSILSMRQTDDIQNAFPLAPSEYPPLTEMLGPEFSLDDFIVAARALPLDKYDCRLCELSFVTRSDMHQHCETVHDMSRQQKMDNGGIDEDNENYLWCDVCLRPFDDQASYELHTSFHRRIRSMISRGELELSEMAGPVM